jgi:hypothetical protein
VLEPDAGERIPEPLVLICAELLAEALPPAGIDRLAFALTPGFSRTRGDRRRKALAWLRSVNETAPAPPLWVLGRVIAAVGEDRLDAPHSGPGHPTHRQRLDAELAAAGLKFVPPDRILRVPR